MGVKWRFEETSERSYSFTQVFWLFVPYTDLLMAKSRRDYPSQDRWPIDDAIDWYDSGYSLSSKLTAWLVHNNIGYIFRSTNLNCRLEIDTPENAMKFKLRWC